MAALLLGTLVIVAAFAIKGLRSSPPTQPSPPPLTNSPDASTAPAQHPDVQPIEPHDEAATPAEPVPVPTPARVAAIPSAPPPEAPPADPKDLLSVLTAFDGKQPITREQARQWTNSLRQLIHQGASSVPAIQQFLAQNLDANFAGVSGADGLGYGSLRSAMLDALAQIGGPESTQAMLQVLQTSIFPTDIASLAKSLDAQDPTQYQQTILAAARQQLALGAMDQLGGANVLPLFQVLATEAANGANITDDLAQYGAKWPYYASIVMASLPDGAGVPNLIQMAQGTLPGNQAAAAQALAQIAPQNTDALNALLTLAKGGQLSDTILSQLAPYLEGRTYQLGPPADPTAGGYLTFHMADGNQDFSATDASGALTQSQIGQRIAVIDQFLQAIPSTDPAAQEALQQQRAALTARQSR
jgi:HEAT repeat protein